MSTTYSIHSFVCLYMFNAMPSQKRHCTTISKIGDAPRKPLLSLQNDSHLKHATKWRYRRCGYGQIDIPVISLAGRFYVQFSIRRLQYLSLNTTPTSSYIMIIFSSYLLILLQNLVFQVQGDNGNGANPNEPDLSGYSRAGNSNSDEQQYFEYECYDPIGYTNIVSNISCSGTAKDPCPSDRSY
jgi:hypothetical protein